MIFNDVLSLAKGRHARRLRTSVMYKILENICAAIPYGVAYLALQLFLDGRQWGHSDIIELTVVVALALAGQFFFGVLGANSAFIGGYRMLSDFRMDLMEHLSRLPLGFFTDKQVGALTATVAENVKMIEDIFTKVIGEMVASFCLPAVIGIILLVIDWRMGVAAIVTVPLAFIVLKMAKRYFTALSAHRIDSQSTASGRLLEYIDGIRVIRGFGLSGEKFSALEAGLDEQRELSIKLEVQGGMTIAVFAIVLEAGFVSLLVVGAYGMLGGALTPSAYLMGLVLSQKFFAPFTKAVFLLIDVKYLSLAMKHIQTIRDYPELPEPSAPQSPKDTEVRLEGVTFRYGTTDKTPALDNVNLQLKSGRTTALVGPSGAGKSTVAHLIARFHDITEGRIRIGGVDVRAMSFDDLMRHVSMVLQDVYLFNDTVAANIRLGRPDASDEALIEAARNAQCHDFIMQLPDGYRTRVGEGGARLSGGQRQRLSIARALLKDAPIILLDESTASVDPESELAFRKAMEKLSAGKTVLVIAHRLNTIRTSDVIIVMDQGRVVQTGTHDELLAEEGVYRVLWQAAHYDPEQV